MGNKMTKNKWCNSNNFKIGKFDNSVKVEDAITTRKVKISPPKNHRPSEFIKRGLDRVTLNTISLTDNECYILREILFGVFKTRKATVEQEIVITKIINKISE